ncbi:MAG: FAD-binding oxidoreductase [Hyphomicrobiales bacterium]|nr:FAD-binding oxidoreductase [Hyphomicrobiales bacterium]
MTPELLNQFAAIVGEKHAIRDAAGMVGYMTEWREIWVGKSPLVMRPGSTEEVSRILKLASETGTAIVPQSGNTGLVGGQIPFESGEELLLSLDRMTKILNVDAPDSTMMVQAGATLKSVQDAADEAGRLFPLSLASEGSCRIGGNLSTNAGGLNVLAYGNARDLCLGLEVVLPDGRIWNGLRRLRKDNTGYDLKNLFIGAEGTLGVITAAVLKLYPKPRTHETAFIAVTSPQAAVDLLSLAKEMSGNRVVAFELLPRIAMDFTVKHMGVSNPLAEFSPWYALSELADPPVGSFETILEEAMARGLVTDATVAQSEAQRQALWAIRELMPESQKFEGGSIKHDVSVPVSRIPQFIVEATKAVENFMPQARVMSFGHMGDGNLHFNVSQPLGMDKKTYLDQWNEMNAVVFDVVLKFDGSISAEHGIGRLKKHHMAEIKSTVELQMMRGLKKLFDPGNIMNPGKVLP